MEQNNIETTRNIVEKTIHLLGFPDADISVSRENGALEISIQTQDAGLLIGKKGGSLRALQHLLLIMVSRSTGERFPPGSFSLDINNYKKERERYLKSLARSAVDEVRSSGTAKELSPMPAVERRIIHLALSSVDDIQTESRGRRPERRVVVKPEEGSIYP